MEKIYIQGTIVTGSSMAPGTVVVKDGRIERVIHEKVDNPAKLVFAGGIDAHVHFREPGMTDKADMATESAAALLGGVTSFMDMPNTRPATTSLELIEQKAALASTRCYANYGFHLGATNDNIGELRKAVSDHPEAFGGIKVFMGSSTGNMLVDRQAVLEEIFAIKGKPVLVHSEDEDIIKANLAAARERFGDEIPFAFHNSIRSAQACIQSTAKALGMAVKEGTRLHILHISTDEEIRMIVQARKDNPRISAETSANYLWFSEEDYDRLGARLKCNPAVKTVRDREGLRKALASGSVDTIGSDHAPHLAREKEGRYVSVPSGIPSIQHTLPVLLSIAAEEGIPLTRIASVFSEKPAEIFSLYDRGRLEEGCRADIVVVDSAAQTTVRSEDLMYKCGWSPYEGTVLKGRVESVYVNGVQSVSDGKISGSPAGERLAFGI